MKSTENPNTFEEEKPRMTLRSYFRNLPNATYPRRDLIDKICDRCKVPYTTARSWLAYGIKPSNEDHIKALSEITGINPDDMWAND